jgi:hypothetical protein
VGLQQFAVGELHENASPRKRVCRKGGFECELEKIVRHFSLFLPPAKTKANEEPDFYCFILLLFNQFDG